MARTRHTNSQAGWWMSNDLGLFGSHRTLTAIVSTINYSVYQRIHESNVRPSVKEK